jgi:hypothetical protein
MKNMKGGEKYTSHPLFGTSITNWFHVLIDNGEQIMAIY